MPIKYQYLIVSALLVFALKSNAQSLDFFREDLTFEIDSACFYVQGDYYFRNNEKRPREIDILYPVPKNDYTKLVDTIMVFDQKNISKPLDLSVKDSVFSFKLFLNPVSTSILKVFYRQHHDGKSCRYILLTTQKWGKPIENARYSLVVKQNIKIISFSYPPDSMKQFGDSIVYFWDKKNFMPDRDFIIYFDE
ncbi:MAG: DUF4424 family protein [Lentimicrobiaceae bacterium]|jgi:hypothetical protein|nr:DUF4424 family protein [Lentimicrobiaceae bacterium]